MRLLEFVWNYIERARTCFAFAKHRVHSRARARKSDCYIDSRYVDVVYDRTNATIGQYIIPYQAHLNVCACHAVYLLAVSARRFFLGAPERNRDHLSAPICPPLPRAYQARVNLRLPPDRGCRDIRTSRRPRRSKTLEARKLASQATRTPIGIHWRQFIFADAGRGWNSQRAA